MKPLMLDLFCGAGGCAKGYSLAGFDVVGVDHRPQPRYPFPFIQADVMDVMRMLLAGWSDRDVCGKRYRLSDFAAIHASPPCQRFSVGTKAHDGRSKAHPDLIDPVRKLLVKSRIPYVIENVVCAPVGGIMLCGSMFGLLVQRHRWFESSEWLYPPGPCRHKKFSGEFSCGRSSQSKRAGEKSRVVHVYGNGNKRGDCDLWKTAMGIDWMTMKEMAQAIPPAYTQFLGEQLIRLCEPAGLKV